MSNNIFDVVTRVIDLKEKGVISKVVTYDSDAEKEMHINMMLASNPYVIEDYTDTKTLIFINM